MPAPYDFSEFVDTDAPATSPRSAPAPTTATLRASVPQRPPTREELEAQVTSTQQRLAELKRQQEELERERAAVEEARRRRVEFQTGREEMLLHLTRGVALLEETDLAVRREAEQMSKSLAALRESLSRVQSLNEEAWTKENCSTELTRALTTIENSRMEWNTARLKWPLLDGKPDSAANSNSAAPMQTPALLDGSMGFGQLCRIGLALTWPVALAVLIALGVLLLRK